MTKPAIDSRHFECPHCEAQAEHAWLNAYVAPISNAAGVPLRIAGDDLQRLAGNPEYPEEVREQKVAYWNRVNAGEVFIERWAPVQSDIFVAGMELSVCLECRQTAVWLGGELVYPAAAGGPG